MELSKSPNQCSTCEKRCLSVLSHLRAEDINAFDSLRKTNQFDENSVLPLIENNRDIFYCIQAGHIKICHPNGGVIRICGPGDIVGYNERSAQHPYTLISMGFVQVCSFDRELFLYLQSKSMEMAQAFLQYLSREIMIRDERILSLENYTVKNRVAATLLSLNKKFGQNSENGSKINIITDRKTLAQLSGTVVESLARTLTEFENESIIQRKGRYIYVLNKDRLQHIASN